MSLYVEVIRARPRGARPRLALLASVNAEQFPAFPPEEFSLRWYVAFFESEACMGSLFFSLRLAFFATVVSTALGVDVALYNALAAHRSGAITPSRG